MFKKLIANFAFNFVNSFWEIIDKIWEWTLHKSCTFNKFYFLGWRYNTFITMFINLCNFFVIFVNFYIFPKTFKVSLKIVCCLIVVWSVVKNYRNFVRHIKSWVTYTICSASVFTCKMEMVSNFSIVFIFSKLFWIFFSANETYCCVLMRF